MHESDYIDEYGDPLPSWVNYITNDEGSAQLEGWELAPVLTDRNTFRINPEIGRFCLVYKLEK